MELIQFDCTNPCGGFKPMNAVNNGPHHSTLATDQFLSNLEAFKAANIPFVRTHDASYYANYGGEHTVDITAVFPNFDADEKDPASYDFACTDNYLAVIGMAGSKVFYRLGQKIEHFVKKFGTLPPKDFKKWAVICEHIIRHYTEGWADGFHYDIAYWEIWNEADLNEDDCDNKLTWGGTKAQFFDLYEITAKHLKQCFPHLKIGGPALAFREDWADDFLAEMRKRNVPIDFFSWHRYCSDPWNMIGKSERLRAMMDKHGYENAESINNEWNYIKEWGTAFSENIKTIISMKGAAFVMASMSAAQKSTIDMMMYYDARPCVYNGMFDLYTLEPLKGYYPFLWFSKLADLREVRSDADPKDIYTLCGTDENGKVTAIVTYYTDDDGMPNKNVKLDFGKEGKYEVFALDEEHTNEKIGTSLGLEFALKPNSCLLIQEV